jgi:hypothetical protein
MISLPKITKADYYDLAGWFGCVLILASFFTVVGFLFVIGAWALALAVVCGFAGVVLVAWALVRRSVVEAEEEISPYHLAVSAEVWGSEGWREDA